MNDDELRNNLILTESKWPGLEKDECFVMKTG